MILVLPARNVVIVKQSMTPARVGKQQESQQTLIFAETPLVGSCMLTNARCLVSGGLEIRHLILWTPSRGSQRYGGASNTHCARD